MINHRVNDGIVTWSQLQLHYYDQTKRLSRWIVFCSFGLCSRSLRGDTDSRRTKPNSRFSVSDQSVAVGARLFLTQLTQPLVPLDRAVDVFVVLVYLSSQTYRHHLSLSDKSLLTLRSTFVWKSRFARFVCREIVVCNNWHRCFRQAR